MIDHDRIFKELIKTFFLEFVELFLPDVYADLDRETIEFLDKEVFTDVTSGEKHEVDLIAKARFRGQDWFFLFHVEAQADDRKPPFPSGCSAILRACTKGTACRSIRSSSSRMIRR